MRLLLKPLIILIITIQPAYAGMDGRWQLVIDGVDELEFGTQFLAGGLTMKWQSILEFSVVNGQFEQGTATAGLKPEISAYSRPDGMFQCNQVTGTFASRTGSSFSTPHLRYQAFPLTGKVVEEKIQLNPFLEYPGNYYAVMYQCQTDDERGQFWAERSPRVSRELGKRQDADVQIKAGRYSAHIKEIKTIAPGPMMELPLRDGLEMTIEDNFGARNLRYTLRRIADQ